MNVKRVKLIEAHTLQEAEKQIEGFHEILGMNEGKVIHTCMLSRDPYMFQITYIQALNRNSVPEKSALIIHHKKEDEPETEELEKKPGKEPAKMGRKPTYSPKVIALVRKEVAAGRGSVKRIQKLALEKLGEDVNYQGLWKLVKGVKKEAGQNLAKRDFTKRSDLEALNKAIKMRQNSKSADANSDIDSELKKQKRPEPSDDEFIPDAKSKGDDDFDDDDQ